MDRSSESKVVDPFEERKRILRESISPGISNKQRAKFVRKTYHITPELINQIRDYAYSHDMQKSEVIRQALSEFFKK